MPFVAVARSREALAQKALVPKYVSYLLFYFLYAFIEIQGLVSFPVAARLVVFDSLAAGFTEYILTPSGAFVNKKRGGFCALCAPCAKIKKI